MVSCGRGGEGRGGWMEEEREKGREMSRTGGNKPSKHKTE